MQTQFLPLFFEFVIWTNRIVPRDKTVDQSKWGEFISLKEHSFQGGCSAIWMKLKGLGGVRGKQDDEK
jgi:hypothetical protein